VNCSCGRGSRNSSNRPSLRRPVLRKNSVARQFVSSRTLRKARFSLQMGKDLVADQKPRYSDL